MANPMAEFKKSYTKEFDVGGRTFVLRSLSTGEVEDIEATLRRKYGSSDTDSLSQPLQKTEVLCRAIVSVDGIPIRQFDTVIADSGSMSEEDAVRKEVSSWDDTVTAMLHLCYLSLIKEKDERFRDDVERFRKFLEPARS